MASSLVASQTLLTSVNHRLTFFSKPKPLCFSPLQIPSKSRIYASISRIPENPLIKPRQNAIPAQDLLSGSTRTVTTLLAITLAASKLLSRGILSLGLQLKEPMLSAAGPAFFAAMKNVPTGSLNTPFTVVAAGMAKWLDIYSGVLMVRVLLSWFPNIPWDRQPLSAIRDLCDPYLNLFRNIIPPVFNTLDVSPLLAFAVLGTLGSILNSSRQAS